MTNFKGKNPTYTIVTNSPNNLPYKENKTLKTSQERRRQPTWLSKTPECRYEIFCSNVMFLMDIHLPQRLKFVFFS